MRDTSTKFQISDPIQVGSEKKLRSVTKSQLSLIHKQQTNLEKSVTVTVGRDSKIQSTLDCRFRYCALLKKDEFDSSREIMPQLTVKNVNN